MEAAQFDRVVVTAFFSVLVAFVTAAMSVVRLVNDKESKTTDYRQAWNESVRKAFSELISNINVYASVMKNEIEDADHSNLVAEEISKKDKDKVPPALQNISEFLDKRLLDEASHLRDLRKNLHLSYALTRLHFKPNDLSFSRVEQKFDHVMELLNQMSRLSGSEKESEREVIKGKVRAAADDIASFARDILKIEWETVKRGERAYVMTKKWSFYVGFGSFVALLGFGLAATLGLLHRDRVPNDTRSTSFGAREAPRPSALAPAETMQQINVHCHDEESLPQPTAMTDSPQLGRAPSSRTCR